MVVAPAARSDAGELKGEYVTRKDRERWDAKYRERGSCSPGAPADWLVRELARLPRGGRALDLAAGDGANSLLLASRGWKVTAVDISPIGLAIGQKVAGPLPIDWVIADLDDYLPTEAAFDLVLCFRFLDRLRLPDLAQRALKPGGLFLAETFHAAANDSSGDRPKNPDYLLREGEWPTLFPGWEVLEERCVGGSGAILARKPA